MQHLLLLSLITALLTVGTMVVMLGKDAATSISLHAVKHPWAFFTMAVGVTISLVLAVVFYITWFQPMFNASTFSSILFGLIIVFFFIVVWVPDVVGYHRKIHRSLAYGAVFAMPIFLASLLPDISATGLTVLTLAVIVSHTVMVYLLLFVKAAYRYFLPLQAVYLAGFFVVLLAATYLGVH